MVAMSATSRLVPLDLAATNHWTVVDMKRDWKVILSFEGQ